MTLLAADSFLVAEGKVRGSALHRSRFGSSCARYGVPVDEFWNAEVAAFPQQGKWFPRFELHDDLSLTLSIRPAPPLRHDVTVEVHRGPDPRRQPLVKGPDLDVLGALREQSAADEVLLTGPGATILEAAYAAVMWWEGDVLCTPPRGLPVLPSVTVALIRGMAEHVAERARRVEDLDGAEVWLVNALHGIRPVRAWIGSALTPGVPDRAAEWRDRLTRTATAPIP